MLTLTIVSKQVLLFGFIVYNCKDLLKTKDLQSQNRSPFQLGSPQRVIFLASGSLIRNLKHRFLCRCLVMVSVFQGLLRGQVKDKRVVVSCAIGENALGTILQLFN